MLKEILSLIAIGVIGISSGTSEYVCCDDGSCASCVRDEVYYDLMGDMEDDYQKIVIYPHNAWDIDEFERLMLSGCEYETYETSIVFLEITEMDENDKGVVSSYTTHIFVKGKE